MFTSDVRRAEMYFAMVVFLIELKKKARCVRAGKGGGERGGSVGKGRGLI